MFILFCVALLDLIGFGIVIPILPFLSPQLGASNMDIALIVSTYAVCAAFCAPAWGRLSDRIGRKPVLLICLVGAALSYAVLGFADALWMVFAARAFAGGMAGNFTVASAMVADMLPAHERARGMGVIGGAFGLGMVLGPLLGGWLSAGDGSFTLPCIVAGGMSVLALLAAAWRLPETLPADKSAAQQPNAAEQSKLSTWLMLRQTGNRLLVLQYVLHTVCISSATYLFPLWVGAELGWTAHNVGTVFAIQGAIMVVLQLGVIGPAVRVMGEIWFLRLGIGFFLMGISLAIVADTAPVMVAALFIAISGGTVCMPMLSSLVAARTPLPIRGRMLGVTGAASSWGRVIGPLLAGTNLTHLGFSGAWLVCALVLCCYLTWALSLNAGTAPGLVD